MSGQRMAIDASLIKADANKQNSTHKEEWDASDIDPTGAPRAVREYLDTLDEAAFWAASEVQSKFTSQSDPVSKWTAARKGPVFFSHSDNYLIDNDHGIIIDVEATRPIRQTEVGSTNSSSPPQPKASANQQRSFLRCSKREKPEKKGTRPQFRW